VAPFIIADVTGRDVRVPQERSHANDVTGVGTVTVAVRDITTVRDWYAKVLGRPGEAVQRPDIGGTGLRFTIGPHTFDFVAPAQERGPLADWLAQRGPSPYAVRLKAGAGTPRPLDLSRTHGARIVLE
jgi:catechol 2,3-dioxygenase-like lactoylglutathione lyase family enzyme